MSRKQNKMATHHPIAKQKAEKGTKAIIEQYKRTSFPVFKATPSTNYKQVM